MTAPVISLLEFSNFSEKLIGQSSLSIGIVAWYYNFGSNFSADLRASEWACSKPYKSSNSLSIGWPHHN